MVSIAAQEDLGLSKESVDSRTWDRGIRGRPLFLRRKFSAQDLFVEIDVKLDLHVAGKAVNETLSVSTKEDLRTCDEPLNDVDRIRLCVVRLRLSI